MAEILFGPRAADGGDGDRLTKPTRENLARDIRAFLASEITAFEFDERLGAYRESDDSVLQHVVQAVWYHYDDCDDHLVCLSKPEWDYFQRLLLILAADCQLEEHTERYWSSKQLVAAVTLLGFLFCAWQTGWGEHLLIVAMPFGLVSIALSFWRICPAVECSPYQPVIFPFATFADLARAYHRSAFRKTRYPQSIRGRKIRSPLMAAFWTSYTYVMWLMYSPFPLLFQSFPEAITRTQVKAA